MKCLVRIDNGTEILSLCGNLEVSGCGFKLLYKLNGDDCYLLYDGKTLRQTHGGETPIEMLFCEGKQTDCNFGLGEMRGTLPVFTSLLKVQVGGGIKVRLKYEFGGENFNLTVTAEQEKK